MTRSLEEVIALHTQGEVVDGWDGSHSVRSPARCRGGGYNLGGLFANVAYQSMWLQHLSSAWAGAWIVLLSQHLVACFCLD